MQQCCSHLAPWVTCSGAHCNPFTCHRGREKKFARQTGGQQPGAHVYCASESSRMRWGTPACAVTVSLVSLMKMGKPGGGGLLEL